MFRARYYCESCDVEHEITTEAEEIETPEDMTPKVCAICEEPITESYVENIDE